MASWESITHGGLLEEEEDPPKKRSLDPLIAQFLGLPTGDMKKLARPWLFVNPDNIRPQPFRSFEGMYGSRAGGEVDVIPMIEDAYEPTRDNFRGLMGWNQSIQNGLTYDTLYKYLGEPEGGISLYPGITEPDQYLEARDGGVMQARHFTIADRIELTKGKYGEREFASDLTHEFVHGTQRHGVPEDLPFADELQFMLEKLERMAGDEGSANVMARALESIRTTPSQDRQYHSDLTSFVPAGFPEEYHWSEDDAKAAVDWWYKALGRE